MTPSWPRDDVNLKHRKGVDAMKSINTNDRFAPYNVDRQLIAAVQINSGARCHKAANLLHCYGLAALAYDSAVAEGDVKLAEEMLAILRDSEINLRKFLFQRPSQERFDQLELHPDRSSGAYLP
jgi:hypothetical protein